MVAFINESPIPLLIIKTDTIVSVSTSFNQCQYSNQPSAYEYCSQLINLTLISGWKLFYYSMYSINVCAEFG